MMGFMNILNIINYLDYRPKYEHNKCVRNISSKASCTACKDVCSYEAITINRRSIKIEDNCKACNECVSYCPSNALVDTGKKFIGASGKVYLLCEKFKIDDNISGDLKVGCLNFINIKILLNLYILGYREIHTNLDKCSDCSKTSNLDEELIKTNEILSKLNKDLMSIENKDVESLIIDIKDIDKLKSNAEIDRRGFFKQIAKDFYSKTSEVAPPASRDQAWYSISKILEKWNSNNKDKLSVFDIETDPNKCIQCRACEKLCPEKVWNTKEDVLEERLDLCSGCKLCEDICPTKAIVVKENIKLMQRQIFKKDTMNCTICNKEYNSYKEEIDTCPSCIGKKAFNRKG